MNKLDARKKAKEIVGQMTLEEKVSQMLYEAPAIERLGLPSYNWWNESLHGVARAGLATVFPQSIGLAATFDPDLLEKVGQVIGKEGRIKNELARLEGDREIYKGLTFWSPNINIARDPRWGRAHETYGEDPYLTSRMGENFVKGIQGNDPERLQAAACVKHYAVHSGPESIRHGFNSKVSRKDMAETYLPAFEKVIKDADVAGLMTAYNAVNGIPMSAHKELIQEVARAQWGFDGYVVSDCGAISDIYERHHYTDTKAQAAGAAAEAGCELNCGSMYGYLVEAAAKGYVSVEAIDRAVEDLMTVRFRLELDGPVTRTGKELMSAWSAYRKVWEELSFEASVRSMVLLKNNGILPLKAPKTIAVIGPDADSKNVLKGNYSGTAGEWTTVLEGIRARFPESEVWYSEGAHLYKDNLEGVGHVPYDRLSEAAAFARYADVTILVVGLDPSIEGELGDASNEYAAGDKHDLRLPPGQRELVKKVMEVSENVVVVLVSGGALDLGEDDAKAAAILQAWYPGSRGGDAVAAILKGDRNPTGRLPETFYKAEQATWDFSDYDMTGRTYRYFEGEPRYAFGFGLGYEYLTIENAKLQPKGVADADTILVTLSNPYDHAVAMPLTVYAKIEEEGVRTPRIQLVGVERISLSGGEFRTVEVPIDPYWICVVEEDGTRRKATGKITYYVGDKQPSETSVGLEA